MGDNSVEEDSPKTIFEFFSFQCPTYMAWGMSYDEFWNGDPWLAWYYREAYKVKRKAENERDWLLGGYVYHATATAVGNLFRKRGARAQKYIEKPFQIFKPTKAEREAEERAQAQKMQAFWESMLHQKRLDAEEAAEDYEDGRPADQF